MPKLPPAAQAVLDAFEDDRDGKYVEGVWVVNERAMLASALRAAADQVVPKDGHMVFDDHSGALERIRGELLDIAKELDAQ